MTFGRSSPVNVVKRHSLRSSFCLAQYALNTCGRSRRQFDMKKAGGNIVHPRLAKPRRGIAEKMRFGTIRVLEVSSSCQQHTMKLSARRANYTFTALRSALNALHART